jgi:hypothetical protein
LHVDWTRKGAGEITRRDSSQPLAASWNARRGAPGNVRIVRRERST